MPIAFSSLNFTFIHIRLHLHIFSVGSYTRGTKPCFSKHNEQALLCANEHLSPVKTN